MYIIEPWGGFDGDEELRAIGIWATVSHGEGTGFGVSEVWMEFILEEIPWKSVTGTSRRSALYHKIFDDPVENGLWEEWFGDNRCGGKVDPLAGSFC